MGTAIREPSHAAHIIAGARITDAGLAKAGFTPAEIAAWAAPSWAPTAAVVPRDRRAAVIAYAKRVQRALDRRAEQAEAAKRATAQMARIAAPARCTECGASLHSVRNHAGGSMPTMCFDCA